MPSALADVEWDACVLQPHRDRELEDFVRRQLGAVPSSVAYFTGVPWVVRSIPAIAAGTFLHLPPELGDLIGLIVSQDNSCRYCFGVQRLMLRIHGVPDTRIRQLEHGLIEAEIDPRARSALDFGRRISRAAPLPAAADTSELRSAGWSVEAIREMAFCAVANVYMNRLMTTAAIPYAPVEGLADQWTMRLLAPLIRFASLRRERRALERAAALPPERARGPFSYLVAALDGLPVARVVRETLDAALASPTLSTRAKGLIFAVVARGLDSAQSGREGVELIAGTGLAPEIIDSTLTHLGSPELSPVENALVSFARGTIRGRPVRLQQQTRELLALLSQNQLVEAIAVAALANLVTRLDVVTEV